MDEGLLKNCYCELHELETSSADNDVNDWPGVDAQRDANSDTDANSEAIVFFASRKSFGYGAENWRRSRPWRSPRHRSQCANADSKTNADPERKDKVVPVIRAQIADRDAHTGESDGVCDTDPNAVPAKRNFARSAAIANFFARGRKRIARSHTNAVADGDADAITDSNANINSFNPARFSADKD